MAIRNKMLILALVVLATTLPAFAKVNKKSVTGFDPAADPAAQVEAAIKSASAGNRHILLEIGGEWCSWCHKLEKFMADNREVREALDARFVLVKINVSPENENVAFLSDYPEVRGYPHLLVLDGDGSFLHSQETGALESGESYDATRWLEFVAQWGGGS